MSILAELRLAVSDPRARLVYAMAEALAEKRYAAISVADVVRFAHVSKRTFYEQFASREECYLATYEAVCDALLARISRAASPELLGEARFRAAIHAYLAALEQIPALARSFFTEIQLAGPAALVSRRKVHQRFADLTRTLVAQQRAQQPEVNALSPDLAIALVGACDELLRVRIEQGRLRELTALCEVMVELFRALLFAAPAPALVRTPAPSRLRRSRLRRRGA